MGEDASADYEIPRAMELEKKQVTGRERLELARPARLPEVDLFEVRLVSKQLEPVEVCDANV